MTSVYSQIARSEKQTEEFRVLELVKKSAQRSARRKAKKIELLPPRTNVMPVDQDWSSVWPGPRSFHPASVPLPLRQGYNKKGVSPGKFANAELMKIPNFLHLTPPAIKKHCEALKKFCTPWPEELNDENCEKHFPVEVITSDYCFSSPDIREPMARIVILKVKLSALTLDKHAKDKLLRLVGERYDPSTDILTLTTDRCPLKKQNYEYALYLLTALYHESQKTEPWESEKTVADMEYYDWEQNVSYKNVLGTLNWPQSVKDTENFKLTPEMEEYKKAISDLMNKGEDLYTISKYKEATKKLLNLPEFLPLEYTTA
ncbi:hypothetical protein R5R35_007588 [Gryllus longicercus]